MTPEQKKMALELAGLWNENSYHIDWEQVGNDMAALLRGLIDAPEQAAGVPELARDAELLDALEDEVKSRGAHGLTLCYASYAEDGYVLEKGFRVIGRKFIGPRKATLREAIDAAIPVNQCEKGA